MRSDQLHRAAVQYSAPEPPPPAPTRDRASAMSAAARDGYAAQARRWLNGQYFDSTRDRGLRDAFDTFVQDNADSYIGTRDLLILTGANCLGKSTLLTTWAMRHYLDVIGPWTDPETRPRHQTEARIGGHLEHLEVPTVPVLVMSLPADTTVAKFDQQIFLALGYTPAAQSRFSYLDVILRHRVRVIVIDDLHLLATTEKRGRYVLDHIKEMLTAVGEYGISVIVAGANLSDQPLMDDPQVTRRALEHLILPYSGKTDADRESWQWFLKDAEDHIRPLLPALEEGTLYNGLAADILERTDGIMRDVVTVLKEAPVQAIRDGSWTITTTHLDKARVSISTARRRDHKDRPAPTPAGRPVGRPRKATA